MATKKKAPKASTFRCYCCGATLGETFALVTMQKSTDRAFTMLPEHVARVDDAESTIVRCMPQDGKD